MQQGYAGCFKGVGGVFFFSSGVVSGIVQYTIFLFLFCVLDDHCFIIIIYRFLSSSTLHGWVSSTYHGWASVMALRLKGFWVP